MFRKSKTWLNADNDDNNNSTQNCRIVSKVAPAKVVPKSSNEKFSRSMARAKELCAILAECGDSQYGLRYQVLLDLLKIWSKGDEAVVAKVVAGSLQVASQTGIFHNFSSHDPMFP